MNVRKRLLDETSTRAQSLPEAPPRINKHQVEESPAPDETVDPIPETSALISPLYGLPPPSLEPATLDDVLNDRTSLERSQIALAPMEWLALASMWNACLPVNKLPVEILVEIIQYVPDRPFMHSDRVNSPDWALLGPVCRHWRSVLLTHACFWRTILVRKHPH
ncbi:hypothetical protein C2E23DRAFT_355494 [Lenzites betulinus]|nr:hypothetical protein C2E23DRAFT_355494 [Lenzites betulinus]